MRNDKYRALRLRMKGRSYNEINRLLKIPKSTLSTWFSGLDIPNKAQERLKKRIYKKATAQLIARNKRQSHIAEQRARFTRNNSRKDMATLSMRDLLHIGTILYWTEGYKRPIVTNGKTRTYHPVSFTNSDPNIIKLYMRFLREVCEVSEQKIRIEIRMHKHHNTGYIVNFWSTLTGIAPSNIKTFMYGPRLSGARKESAQILPYGTVQVRVNETRLYHRIMGWIEGLGSL